MKTGTRLWLQCSDYLRYRVGKAELISVGAAVFAAMAFGAVMLFPDVGTQSVTGVGLVLPPDAGAYTLEERPRARLVSVAPEVPARTLEWVAPPPAAPNAEYRKLAQENEALKTRMDDLLKWMLTTFRGKYPVQEKFMQHLQMAPLTEDFLLNAEVAEFLNVSPVEARRMNDAFQSAGETLHKIEASTITVKNPRPDKVILNIPPFAQDGRTLKEDLYAALEVTLGGARFDRFLEVSEKGLNNNFYHFGTASRTMIFELAEGLEGADPQLVIRDAWVIPGENNTKTIQAEESVVTNLPPKYYSYMTWLPDYVAAYATP